MQDALGRWGTRPSPATAGALPVRLARTCPALTGKFHGRQINFLAPPGIACRQSEPHSGRHWKGLSLYYQTCLPCSSINQTQTRNSKRTSRRVRWVKLRRKIASLDAPLGARDSFALALLIAIQLGTAISPRAARCTPASNAESGLVPHCSESPARPWRDARACE